MKSQEVPSAIPRTGFVGEVDRVCAPSDDYGGLFADAPHISRAEAQPFEAAGEGVGNIPSSAHFNRDELYRPFPRDRTAVQREA